jgi:hypothetical protein
MDRAAVAVGTTAGATALVASFVVSPTPEAAVLSVLAAGGLTGALSDNFQSEFLDAWAACTLGTGIAVVALFGPLGAAGTVNELTGNTYNIGLVATLGMVATAPVVGLIGAFAGRYGALLRRRLARTTQRS